MAITRRHLLAAATATAAAAAVCAGGIGASWWDTDPGTGFDNLSATEATFVRSISAAAFPAGQMIDLSGGDADLDHFFDEMISGMPSLTGDLLKLLVNALEHLTVPTHGARFTLLPLDARQAALDGWLSSGQAEVRGAVQSLVIMLAMGYTTHPDVAPTMASWHRCGYGR